MERLPVKNLNVALAPMNIVWGDKAANFDTLISLVDQLHEDTHLLILPETFSTGFPAGMKREEVKAMAERNTGKTIETLHALAKQYDIAICGSFVADTGGLLYNRAFFIEPTGDEYFADKKHLFTMANEQAVFNAGDSRLQVRYMGWSIAMVVCYDVRFPVWCRNADPDYQLLVAVANWPAQRVDAWEQLLKARAIENEAYVCGVDCCGVDPFGNIYNGSSPCVDFKGKAIGNAYPLVNIKAADALPATHADKVPAPHVIYATLDAEKLANFREKFPAWRDADSFRIL